MDYDVLNKLKNLHEKIELMKSMLKRKLSSICNLNLKIDEMSLN